MGETRRDVEYAFGTDLLGIVRRYINLKRETTLNCFLYLWGCSLQPLGYNTSDTFSESWSRTNVDGDRAYGILICAWVSSKLTILDGEPGWWLRLSLVHTLEWPKHQIDKEFRTEVLTRPESKQNIVSRALAGSRIALAPKICSWCYCDVI